MCERAREREREREMMRYLKRFMYESYGSSLDICPLIISRKVRNFH